MALKVSYGERFLSYWYNIMLHVLINNSRIVIAYWILVAFSSFLDNFLQEAEINFQKNVLTIFPNFWFLGAVPS